MEEILVLILRATFELAFRIWSRKWGGKQAPYEAERSIPEQEHLGNLIPRTQCPDHHPQRLQSPSDASRAACVVHLDVVVSS